MNYDNIKEALRLHLYKLFCKRISLSNHSRPTIICNDCVAGLIYNQLNLPFLSPTINIRIKHKDFVELCLYFDDYINEPLVEAKSNTGYITGVLCKSTNPNKTIELLFIHENSFEDGKNKWDRRKTRVDKDNIFIVFDNTLLDECLIDELIPLFKKIPYKKIMLCRSGYEEKYKDINDAFFIRFPNCVKRANALSYVRWGYRRYFNKYNFVRWFNKGYKK